MTKVVLEAQAVSKTFELDGKAVSVLKDLDLTVHERESVAVVGQSGAGKSTLLHLLGALDTPNTGTILFNGQNINTLSAAQRSKFRNESIGFMFQFHHLLPEFSAVENVMMPLLIARMARGDAEDIAKSWLARVGLEHRFEHRPSELSGGEQQRVALARALVRSPKLLLADEPTGNLDHETGAHIHGLFSELSEESGTSMVIVTHNLVLARAQSRQLSLQDGLLVEEMSV